MKDLPKHCVDFRRKSMERFTIYSYSLSLTPNNYFMPQIADCNGGLNLYEGNQLG